MKNLELKTGIDDNGRRLDRILRKSLPNYSLSLIHRLVRQGKIKVNEKKVSADFRINDISIIKIQTNEVLVTQTISYGNKNNLDLPEIIWKGSGIIFFNKPSGLTTHGINSLDSLAKTWLAGKIPHSLSFRPGPLHRLDKLTSGLIAFSHSLEGAKLFSLLLREHKIKKTYLAIVEGSIKKECIWEDFLTRNKTEKKTYVINNVNEKTQIATTIIKPLAFGKKYTLIEAQILTGRTHQIRAQAAAHGHPLANDIKYGGHNLLGNSFYLHAWKLKFSQEGFPSEIVAPIPDAFNLQIKSLFPGY